jgi:hypothetical protein
VQVAIGKMNRLPVKMSAADAIGFIPLLNYIYSNLDIIVKLYLLNNQFRKKCTGQSEYFRLGNRRRRNALTIIPTCRRETFTRLLHVHHKVKQVWSDKDKFGVVPFIEGDGLAGIDEVTKGGINADKQTADALNGST